MGWSSRLANRVHLPRQQKRSFFLTVEVTVKYDDKNTKI